MGAWIETSRALKHAALARVAPYVGAWIETLEAQDFTPVRLVAPYVGAWIETLYLYRKHVLEMSHPTWVRGLKPYTR